MSEQEINPNVFLHSNGLSTERNVVVSVMRMLGADDFDFRLRDRLIVGSAGWIDKERREHAKQLAAARAERDELAAKVDAAAKYIHELRSYPQTIHPKLHAAAVAYYELTPDTEAT